MEEPTHVKPLNTENAIAFLKLLSVEDRPIMVIDGCEMCHCVVGMASNPTAVMIYNRCGQVIGELHISIPENYNWDDMGMDCIIEMLETYVYDYGVVWKGWGFDLSDFVLGNTTIFKVEANYYYMGVEDIPEEERNNAVEIPYDEYVILEPHLIIPLIKSANKQ
jgi:hypothetical protein